MNYLSNLPNSLLITIIEFLKPDECLNLEVVSKNINYKIKNNNDLIWSLINLYSSQPKVVKSVNGMNYNYQWKNYTLSIHSEKHNLKDNFRIALESRNNYLQKNQISE